MAKDSDPLGGNENGNGASIADRAEAGEDDVEPPEDPMRGDAQLSLNIGGVVDNRNARKIEEATIVLQGGERGIDGLLNIDTEYELLVRVLPDAPKPVAIRDPNTRKTRAFKMRQTVQTLGVRRADDADAIRELFADLLGRDAEEAAALVKELGEFEDPDRELVPA